jgi:hypothetical protein
MSSNWGLLSGLVAQHCVIRWLIPTGHEAGSGGLAFCIKRVLVSYYRRLVDTFMQSEKRIPGACINTDAHITSRTIPLVQRQQQPAQESSR